MSQQISSTQLSILWKTLTDELFTVYDAHHVCVVLSQIVSVQLNVTVIVMYKSLIEDYYDVWWAVPNKPTKQLRWDGEQELTVFLDQTAFCVVEKSAESDHPLQSSQLWQTAQERLIVAAFPPSLYEMIPPSGMCILDADFDPLILQGLQALTHYITCFLERAALRYRVTQQDIIFDVVNAISLSLTSTLSLQDIYEKVSNPVRRILNVSSVSIGLVEAETGDILFVRELLGPLFHNLPTIRLKAGQGIGGWVAINNQPVMVNSVYKDHRFFSEADEISGFQTHSLICVPLLVENEVIGIMEAINKLIGQFDDSDLSLMQAIANPLAIALENARLHAEVLSEKRRVEAIFANMSEGMITISADGAITGLNDSVLSLLQMDAGMLLGQPLKKLIKGKGHDLGQFVEEVLSNLDDDPPQIACDIYTNNLATAIPTLISGASVLDENGKVREAIFVISDLSQIREIERMRDDFFHNIVHELRTPLATILMYARLLRQGMHKNTPEKSERFLSVIERESDRLQAMVRQMLALAKLESQEIQRSLTSVNLLGLFEEIVPPLVERAESKGILLKSKISADLPFIDGDRDTLYSVIKNLVENAVKFTLEGNICIEAWFEDQIVYIEISDDGIGIPQESLPSLFKRFYRSRTAVEHGIAGTGLGLYMVKEGIEKHKGTIDVVSQVGKGTTFFIRLPVTFNGNSVI